MNSTAHRAVALAFLVVGCTAAPAQTTPPTTSTTAASTTTTTTKPIDTFQGLRLSGDCGTTANTSNIASIEAIDRYTVVFTLCEPDTALPAKMAFPTLGIQPADHLAETEGAPLTNPIGTGPYRLTAWERGVQLRFNRFDDYWGEPSLTKSLVFRWLSETASSAEAIASGAVDGFAITDEITSKLADPVAFNRLAERQLNVLYLGLNRDIAPFDNDLVRQAVAMAVDKQKIVSDLFPAGSAPADQFLPAELAGYAQDMAPTLHDPERARSLLARAGFSGGLNTTLSYRNVPRSYLPDPAKVANAIRSQLADVGIYASLVQMEPSEFLDAADAGQLPLYILGWEAAIPDPGSFLDFHFGTKASGQFGVHYSDLEQVLTKAESTPDQAARTEFFDQAAELIKDHSPAIPIAHGGSELAFRTDVEGAYASVLGTELFAGMNPGDRDSFIWIQEHEPMGLYCADESERDSLRACTQVVEPLLTYKPGGTEVIPALAEEYTSNRDGTVWTFRLRRGVQFHDGSTLDANDVAASFIAQWDSSSPLHTGRSGQFTYFAILFGGFLNS